MSKNTTNSIYASALKTLGNKVGFTTVEQYIEHATPIVAHLRSAYPNINTRKVKVAAVMNAIKKVEKPVPLAYHQEMASITEATLAASKLQALPAQRREELMNWSDITALRHKAKEVLSAEDFLIYCLYTLNPPVRADYTGMVLLNSWSKHHKADTTRNYCVLHKGNGFFVFNQYKTSKAYGQVIVPIAKPLTEVLRATCTFGEPIISVPTPNALSKRVMSIFRRLTEREKLGIGLLRHSYITTFLTHFQSITKKEEVARHMLHSKAIQELYAVADMVQDADEVGVEAD